VYVKFPEYGCADHLQQFPEIRSGVVRNGFTASLRRPYYSPKLGMIKFDEVGITVGNKHEQRAELISFTLAKPGA
jgi:hypothetical protein